MEVITPSKFINLNPIIVIVILFLSIHLIVGTIRGLYRYKMIEKYIYDYYDNRPLQKLGRLKHNWRHEIFKTTTICISAVICIIIIAVFAFLEIG